MFLSISKLRKAIVASALLGAMFTPFSAVDAKPFLNKQILDVRPLPLNTELSISTSYRQPGLASLNFTVPSTVTGCIEVNDYEVEIKSEERLAHIEFSAYALETFRMVDDKGTDHCAQHSFTEYRLPLDIEDMYKNNIQFIRIWNRTAGEAFALTKNIDGTYKLKPKSKNKYFRIKDYGEELVYKPMPAGAFRVFPDYAPYNLDLLLRKIRAMAKEREYTMYDYTVRYDEYDRPYYILVDNADMDVASQLKEKSVLEFGTVDIDEEGRIVPLRINIGRL